MITVRAGSGAIGVCLLLVLAGCSREQQDWRSAESADTIDSYGQFIQHHPESELATQARARVAQLGEDRDWQRAGSADTVEAYREFLAQHPSGKWAQEAHIRIENFSLGEQAGTDAGTKAASAAGGASGSAGAGGGAAGVGVGAGSGARGTGAARAGGSGAAGPGGIGPSGAGSGSGTASVQGRTAPAGANGSAPGAGGPAAAASAGGSTAGAHSYGLAEPGEAATPMRAAPNASGSTTSSYPTVNAANAPPTHAQPAAAAPPSPKGAYGVQLGAFSTEAAATTQWHLLSSAYPSDLQGLQQHIVPADTASGRVYRLQATVGDESRARAICDHLKVYGKACVAVLPH